ncbi:uncharacterized protein LOC129239057 isoform X4 [Anastrepha obliqua]|uniref:uncharacterized protein LOC129239057 isoform X4 n=1 Tax=Anastrepha obliqua TaxID=95512 RepID=UPI002409E0C2|nr:uncharacterized protein LOC129239057 isoform X4 [Anastrepha obliqua]
MKLFVAILALRSIVPTNTTDLCQGNITCGNGEPHFMCVHQPPRCHPFTLLHLGSDQIHSFLFGHNGIRNRVARQYQIANMNIVHWSVSLELMAERFLGKCRMERDACQDVGPRELQVNQNYLFYKGLAKLEEFLQEKTKRHCGQLLSINLSFSAVYWLQWWALPHWSLRFRVLLLATIEQEL